MADPTAHGSGPRAGLPALPASLDLVSDRLVLEPVTRRHAGELADLLADEELFAWTGRPNHLGPRLADWLGQQEQRRSPTGGALWLTWVLRRPPGSAAAGEPVTADRAGQDPAGQHPGPVVGQVQATVTAEHPEGRQAELSWLVARAEQDLGLATEAVRTVASWLADRLEVGRLHAWVAPGHTASERVAARLGLAPSGELIDGELRWSGPAATPGRAG